MGSKFAPRAERSIFVGYNNLSSTIHKVLRLKSLHICEIRTAECKFSKPLPISHKGADTMLTCLTTSADTFVHTNSDTHTPLQLSLPILLRERSSDVVSHSSGVPSAVLHSSGSLSLPMLPDDNDLFQHLSLAAIIDPDEPRTFRQSLSGSDASRWIAAMNDELSSMHSQQVWTVVPTPPGRNIVGSKWVFGSNGTKIGMWHVTRLD